MLCSALSVKLRRLLRFSNLEPQLHKNRVNTSMVWQTWELCGGKDTTSAFEFSRCCKPLGQKRFSVSAALYQHDADKPNES
nr:hypothetical protein CFP56_42211 [Quercus suber]